MILEKIALAEMTVISHVTIRLAIVHFLLAVLWNQACISVTVPRYSIANVTQWLI